MESGLNTAGSQLPIFPRMRLQPGSTNTTFWLSGCNFRGSLLTTQPSSMSSSLIQSRTCVQAWRRAAAARAAHATPDPRHGGCSRSWRDCAGAEPPRTAFSVGHGPDLDRSTAEAPSKGRSARSHGAGGGGFSGPIRPRASPPICPSTALPRPSRSGPTTPLRSSASHEMPKTVVARNAAVHGAFRYRTYDRRAMSEQPPEDPGKAPVLLVVAVLLAILAIGVVVLVYDRSPAPQRALERLHTSNCRPRARFGGQFS
jgi:hypothetical protein